MPAKEVKPFGPPVWAAFLIAFVILLFVGAMMFWSLNQQLLPENRGLTAALEGHPANHTAAIVYSRVITASVAKTSSLYLAFLLIFLGGSYVLLPIRAAYQAHLEGQEMKGTLTSSSPGLIMVTLGVGLAIATIAIRTDIGYSEQWSDQPNASTSADTVKSRTDSAPWPTVKGKNQ